MPMYTCDVCQKDMVTMYDWVTRCYSCIVSEEGWRRKIAEEQAQIDGNSDKK